MKQILYLLIILPCVFNSAFAQKEVRKQLREGNKLYKQEKYTESEIAYRKSLEKNTRSVESAYNLGNALYKQGKLQEAMEQYQAAAGGAKNKMTVAKAMHNIGNVFMNNKEYDKSVMAYKQSLIINPHDNETRYNLALAQKLLKNQQQQQNKDNKDNKDQKDKQDQKDQQQEQQDKKDKEQQDKQNQQQQPQEEKMSQEKAQQILDALLQDEKNTQDKVQKIQMKDAQRRKTDKDW